MSSVPLSISKLLRTKTRIKIHGRCNERIAQLEAQLAEATELRGGPVATGTPVGPPEAALSEPDFATLLAPRARSTVQPQR